MVLLANISYPRVATDEVVPGGDYHY